MDTTIITTKRKNTVKTPSTSVVSDGTTNNLFAQVLLEYKKNNGKNSSFQGFRTKLTEYANLWYILSNIAGIFVAFIWNFFINRNFTWRRG